MRELKNVDSLIINKIPSDWTWSKLKFVASINGRIGFRGYTVNDIVNEGEGAITLSPSNIDGGKLSLNKITYLSWDKYYESPEIMIEKNHIIFCKTGSSYGKSALIKDILEPMTLNPQLVVIKPFAVNSDFLAYLMESSFIKDQVETIVGGGTMPTISQENLLSMIVMLPNKEEQLKIVSFLNQKTSNIDKVVELKLKQIHLLEQQRQSIITEAVTKGLNPNVKMKDSGVEWIGEVPEHWETKALKYCFKVGNGKEIDIELDKEDDTGINVYGSGGVFKKTDKVLFDGESVLFGRKGTIGKPLYVNDAFWTVDTMYYTKFYKDSNPKWFYYLLLVYPWDMIVTQTALPSIVGSDVANTVCAIPSFEEQVEIAEYLSLKDGKYFKVIASINNQIHKLKEYRQALIYEAVTGKIDVRNLELN